MLLIRTQFVRNEAWARPLFLCLQFLLHSKSCFSERGTKEKNYISGFFILAESDIAWPITAAARLRVKISLNTLAFICSLRFIAAKQIANIQFLYNSSHVQNLLSSMQLAYPSPSWLFSARISNPFFPKLFLIKWIACAKFFSGQRFILQNRSHSWDLFSYVLRFSFSAWL